MAIRSVVTRGYGPGATIPLIVTRGYAVGVVAAPAAPLGATSASIDLETLIPRPLRVRMGESAVLLLGGSAAAPVPTFHAEPVVASLTLGYDAERYGLRMHAKAYAVVEPLPFSMIAEPQHRDYLEHINAGLRRELRDEEDEWLLGLR